MASTSAEGKRAGMSARLSRFSLIQDFVSVKLRGGERPGSMGFHGTTPMVNRMFARLALALRFESASFHGYTPQTERAYSSLIGLFLAWSSFEQVAACTGLARRGGGLNYDKVDALFSQFHIPTEVSEWKGVKPLLSALVEFTTAPGLRRQLQNAVAGQPLHLRVMIAALRHAFAHGPLSAHAGGARPIPLKRACDALTRTLLEVQLHQLESVIGGKS